MGYDTQLKDKNGEKIFPYVHPDNIVDESGNPATTSFIDVNELPGNPNPNTIYRCWNDSTQSYRFWVYNQDNYYGNWDWRDFCTYTNSRVINPDYSLNVYLSTNSIESCTANMNLYSIRSYYSYSDANTYAGIQLYLSLWISDNNTSHLIPINIGTNSDYSDIFASTTISYNGSCYFAYLHPSTHGGSQTQWTGTITKLASSSDINEAKSINSELTLQVSDWDAETISLSKTIPDMGNNDTIFLSPKTKSDKELVGDINLFVSCTNNTVKFEADKVPTENITLNYTIVKGKDL